MRSQPHPPVATLPSRREVRPAGGVFQLLREFALREQSDGPRIFPPIRTMARHFGVSISTVARAYRRLEEEGILRSVRGARTLLQGLKSARQLCVRGFVGLPVFLPWFVTLQDYRAFFLRLRRELWARGFAVATVFYDGEELQRPDKLHECIRKHGFDIVVWHQPDRAAKEVAGRLRDGGMHVVGISDRGFRSFRCRYEVQREQAITAIFRAWRGEGGIESIVIGRREPSAVQEELLNRLLGAAGLDHRCKRLASEGASDFLDSLGQAAREAVVLPAGAAALCACRAPGAFARLMTRARVALPGGAESFPFTPVPDVSAATPQVRVPLCRYAESL